MVLAPPCEVGGSEAVVIGRWVLLVRCRKSPTPSQPTSAAWSLAKVGGGGKEKCALKRTHTHTHSRFSLFLPENLLLLTHN